MRVISVFERSRALIVPALLRWSATPVAPRLCDAERPQLGSHAGAWEPSRHAQPAEEKSGGDPSGGGVQGLPLTNYSGSACCTLAVFAEFNQAQQQQKQHRKFVQVRVFGAE